MASQGLPRGNAVRPLLGPPKAMSPITGRNTEFVKGGHLYTTTKPAQVSSDVHKKEDATVSPALETQLQGLSIRKQKLPYRPEYVAGPAIQLRTNYFEIRMNPAASIYRYNIKISNLEDKYKRKRPRIIELLLEAPFFRAAVSANIGIATDLSGLMVTSKALVFNPEKENDTSRVFDVLYKDRGETIARTGAILYKVEVTFDGSFSIAELTRYLNSPRADGTSFRKEATIQAINTIFRQLPTSRPDVFTGAQNSKFFPLENWEAESLGPGLLALKGYSASVRTSIGRLLVNVNVCTSAFVQGGRLDQIVERFGSEFLLAEKFLIKRRIVTDYHGSQRHKVIQGFARDGRGNILNSQQALITIEGGGRISVAEYFRNQHRHGKALTKPLLPAIVVGTIEINGKEQPIWVPPEECLLVVGQPYGKKLTADQTTKMLNFAAVPPAENARRIVAESARVLGLTEDNLILHNFGFKVNNEMIAVTGRKLMGPNVCYSNKKNGMPTRNGGWDLRGAKLMEAREFPKWSYLKVITPIPQHRRRSVTIDTINEFRKVMGTLGFKIPPCTGNPNGYEVSLNNDWEDIDHQLETVFRTIHGNSIKALFVILDDKNTYVYTRIRWFADIKAAIPTVCAVATEMVWRTPIPSAQYLGNLGLKFNLKLGGINHTLPQGRLGFLSHGTTMIVGIDVAHPSPGQIKEGPSVAAVVASVDKNLAQWPASLRTQSREFKGADEIIKPDTLLEMVTERLKLWQSINKRLPDRILVYRDGVSESQYEQVLDTEVPVFYDACQRLNQSSVKVAFIVVGKRHHTRFSATTEKESDLDYSQRRHGNPKPGTVVDRGVTMENGWDFFLQSHDCLQGTARPAHYVVLRNDFENMGAKMLEQITHDLCYLFGRATRSISVTPPARYADIACERGKQYLYKYLTIRPDGSNADDKYEATLSPWTRSDFKHPLANTMFYI